MSDGTFAQLPYIAENKTHVIPATLVSFIEVGVGELKFTSFVSKDDIFFIY